MSATWQCASISPGVTVAPSSRTTLAPGDATAWISSAEPTAAIRPSRTSMHPLAPAPAAMVTMTASSTISSIGLPSVTNGYTRSPGAAAIEDRQSQPGRRVGVFGRLHPVGGAELYARNAAKMWASLAPWSRKVSGTLPGVSAIEIPAQPAIRVILRRPFTGDPGQIRALVAWGGERGRVVVEDSFGELMLPNGDDLTVDRMPVMVKAADGAGPPAVGAGVRVVQVADRDALAQAERVIVDGFPQRALQPYRP